MGRRRSRRAPPRRSGPGSRGASGRSSSRAPGRSSRLAGNADESQLRTLFRRVDTDGSGKIDREELTAAMGSGAWKPFNESTVTLLMAMFDTNGDGEISFREFKPLWKYVGDWQATFRRYDVDGSGDIDTAELATALKAFGYRFSPDFATFLANHFDRGGEGTLAFDDFVEACVLLQILTDVFRARDNRRSGVVRYAYEDYLTDTLRLLIRFQLA